MPFLLGDDINILVLNYLRDSGFIHSHYTFANESGLESLRGISLESKLRLAEVIQKGLFYNEIESLVHKVGFDASDDDISKSCDSYIQMINSLTESMSDHKLGNIIDVDYNITNLPTYISVNPQCIFNLPETFGPINDYCWGSNNNLVTGHRTGACVCWVPEKNSAENTLLRPLYVSESPVGKSEIICISPIFGTDSFCCGTHSGYIRVFNQNGIKLSIQEFQSSVWSCTAWIDPKSSVDTFVAFSSIDGACTLRHGASLQSVKCIQNFSDSISDSGWSKSGILALSSLDGSISFLCPNTNSAPIAVNLHKGEIYNIEWSINNEYFAVISCKNVAIYSKITLEFEYKINSHRKDVSCLKWVDDDGTDVLITADSFSDMYFHSLDTNEKSWKTTHLYLHTLPINCLQVINPSNTIAASSHHGYIVFINFKKREITKIINIRQQIIDMKCFTISRYLAVKFVRGNMSVINVNKISKDIL